MGNKSYNIWMKIIAVAMVVVLGAGIVFSVGEPELKATKKSKENMM